MPLSDGNPFALSRLVPGVAYTGDLKFSRPFDNGGTSAINADGSTGGNEFTLDGSPNMASGRRVAFVPPAGAVSEFKVVDRELRRARRPHRRRDRERDAQERHEPHPRARPTSTCGATRSRATDFFVKKAGAAKPKVTYDRPGFSLGGPVVIPGLYDGHNRTFAFGAVEWLYDEFPEPGPRTVPIEAMRNGDFSELLAQNILIYDPATAQQVGARVVRTPFPGNIIPTNRLSPIAQQLLKYYPLPNQAGNLGTNNYFSTNPRTDDFYSISTRVDHRLTDKQQVFVRYTRNNRTRIARRLLRRGERHRADRQLPLPHQRRRDGRPRLHDQLAIACSTSAPAGSASRSRTSVSTKGWSIRRRSGSRRT